MSVHCPLVSSSDLLPVIFVWHNGSDGPQSHRLKAQLVTNWPLVAIENVYSPTSCESLLLVAVKSIAKAMFREAYIRPDKQPVTKKKHIPRRVDKWLLEIAEIGYTEGAAPKTSQWLVWLLTVVCMVDDNLSADARKLPSETSKYALETRNGNYLLSK